MRYIFLGSFIFLNLIVFAGPTVPAQMEVAGIRLKLTEQARKDIQKDVDALTRSEKYFNIKMERIRMYFPLIEKIFREENVPEDFKYLVIQESALIGDAVSSSNAVGYWQFKEFTGKEVGLRIDRQVDERMHIIEASRGAAKYFKKNNFYFDNWLYALQAYQMGAGGAQKVVDKKYFGASKMQINKNTYWYVKKFLAHKIAYESAYKNEPRNGRMLAEFKRSGNKNIKEISKELNVNEEELQIYNLWLRKGKIPTDKNYVVLVPIKTMEKKKFVDGHDPRVVANGFKNVYPNENPDKFPMIKDFRATRNYTQEVIKANGLPAIIAAEGNTFDWLALQGAVASDRFFKYNDLKKGDKLKPGEVYYLKKKISKAKIHYHVVSKGETLWEVSQKYGIRLKKLMQKNRMKKVETLEEGRILWLRFIRPADHPIEYKAVPIPEIETQEPDTVVQEMIEKEDLDRESVDSLVLEVDTLVIPEEIMKENSEEIVEVPKLTLKEEKIIHTVAKGETLYGISKVYGVAVAAMIEWNSIEIDENYKLSIGEQLVIYQNASAQDTDIPELKMHKVEPGETLYQISRSYGLSVEEMMELNDMKEAVLQPGDTLKIIEKLEEDVEIENGTKIHEVQPGETLYQIAKKYDLTIQELMEMNQKEGFDLKVGEKLLVSDGN